MVVFGILFIKAKNKVNNNMNKVNNNIENNDGIVNFDNIKK
jgi:hypothetical protein